eukprot:jgi/Mesvir1/15974/Mv08283-RA.1
MSSLSASSSLRNGVHGESVRHDGFCACYLLCSMNATFKGRTYIGFTVNPPRRIRQHNGELVNGARFTSRYRPWEMVLVVFGFSSQRQALQFEWAWQHPKRSKDVRTIGDAALRKMRSGVKGKVHLLYAMLGLPRWQKYPLTVQFLSTRHLVLAPPPTQLPLPRHMAVRVASLDELDLPSYDEGDEEDEPLPPVGEEDEMGDEDEEEEEEEEEDGGMGLSGDGSLPAGDDGGRDEGCSLQARTEAADSAASRGGGRLTKGGRGSHLPAGASSGPSCGNGASCHMCQEPTRRGRIVACVCGFLADPVCLAKRFLSQAQAPPTALIPHKGSCPGCARELTWGMVVARGKELAREARKHPR